VIVIVDFGIICILEGENRAGSWGLCVCVAGLGLGFGLGGGRGLLCMVEGESEWEGVLFWRCL
jgi:hypothetical protein